MLYVLKSRQSSSQRELSLKEKEIWARAYTPTELQGDMDTEMEVRCLQAKEFEGLPANTRD